MFKEAVAKPPLFLNKWKGFYKRVNPRHIKIDLEETIQPEKVELLRTTVAEWFVQEGMVVSVKAAVMAVLEELCTNIMEHSGATWLEVSMAPFKEGVLLSIQDNGSPFDPSDMIEGGHFTKNVGTTMDRHLGLYMVQELAKKFRYFREAEGLNRVVMEVPLRGEQD